MADGQTTGTAKDDSVPSAAVLGEMVWLYSMSEMHRAWPIGSIHQWLLPALIHKQYRLYRKGGKPVGLVTWAHLTTEAETAYVRDTRSLRPGDWSAGDRNWIIDFIAPFGDALRIGHDLRTNVFPDEVGRILQVRKGSDTMRIAYIHGVKAIDRARDWDANPTVDLGRPEEERGSG